MYSRVRILGHPLHQVVVVFPLGLFIAAVVFDFIELVSGNETFGQVAYWNIVGGIIGALIAAPLGLIDWTGIPAGSRAKRVGLLHGTGNAIVLVLFVIAWLARMGRTDHTTNAGLFVLELLALVIGTGAAWLGGELVDQHGIGVSPQADPNAPSSLGTIPGGR